MYDTTSAKPPLLTAYATMHASPELTASRYAVDTDTFSHEMGETWLEIRIDCTIQKLSIQSKLHCGTTY
jgi:hypothetical protein